jgi:hypothetical protein
MQLAQIFNLSTVLFVGYSLGDKYLLELLATIQDLKEILGDGPHFAVLPEEHTALPSSVRLIKYCPEPHRDHRSSIQVVEEVSYISNHPSGKPETTEKRELTLKSAHLLFHILPPGRWTTSQKIKFSGSKREMVVGTGFSNEELPDNRSTAMHDVIVGLLCFDQLYAPLNAVPRLHDLLGSEFFWELVVSDTLRFIRWSQEDAVIFPESDDCSGGELGSFSVVDPKSTREIIETEILPTPGRERLVAELFNVLQQRIVEIDQDKPAIVTPLVRSLLLRPSIRRLLGVSDATPLSSIARWQVFPVLRLASVVRLGDTCRRLQMASAKFDFGAAKLAGPALAATHGNEWADETASYILAGRFSAELGVFSTRHREILWVLLKFRQSKVGMEVRSEVLSRLSTSDASEVTLAVNAGLREGLPKSLLQKARDRFVKLLVAPLPSSTKLPAIWNDDRYSDRALAGWRMRSRTELISWCERLGVSQYGPCPCGSGDKLKFCCEAALRS